MNAEARQRRATAAESGRYEVVVGGGGPAGLSAAIAAAEKGCRSVAVIERKRHWGWPIQCAELVPKLIGQVVPLERNVIVQSITGLRLHVDDAPIGFLRAPGYILDRSRFEANLAERAAKCGVSLWQPARVRAVEDGVVVVAQSGQEYLFEARIIIGADGPRSIVRRALSSERLEMACGIQYVLSVAHTSDEADIFLAPTYGAGYGWCFPRGDVANVGVALPFDRGSELAAALKDLVGRLVRAGKLADTKPIRRSGGLIPAGGPLARTTSGSALLAGDAAGQVHPLTGAGILTACACGRMAGEAAARAVREESLGPLAEYENRWRDLYGGYLARGLESRRRLTAATPDAFADTVRATWHVSERV